MTQHGVLFERVTPMLLTIEHGEWQQQKVQAPTSLLELAELARSQHMTHLWVMSELGDFPMEESGTMKCFTRKIHGEVKMFAASIQKSGWGKNIMIIFPHYSSWWGEKNSPGWLQDASPHNILITLRYLEQALDVTVGASPGRVGWAYLKKLHPQWLEEIPGVNLKKDCHFTGSASPDIIWQRPLLPAERTKKYIHKFDKNAAYPYAASKTDIGVGVPVHVEHGNDAIHAPGHPQEVGVWHCIIKHRPDFPNMPEPYERDFGWLSGPMIRLLRKSGYELEINEGWVFPARHDVMVSWANRLWAMRQGFVLAAGGTWKNRECALLASRAMKQVMNHTVGMTGSSKLDDNDEMKRPDMRVQVIGQHVELTWHNIDKIRKTYGITPVIVYMDAFFFMSDEPEGRKFLPELMKREGQFGGYKWEGRVEVTPSVLAMFDDRMGEAERLEFLNKAGWEK